MTGVLAYADDTRPSPHLIRYPLFIAGRWVAACQCHYGKPITSAPLTPKLRRTPA